MGRSNHQKDILAAKMNTPCRRGEAPPQYMCLRQRISSHASCGLLVRMILMVFSRIFVRKVGTEIYITTRLALRKNVTQKYMAVFLAFLQESIDFHHHF